VASPVGGDRQAREEWRSCRGSALHASPVCPHRVIHPPMTHLFQPFQAVKIWSGPLPSATNFWLYRLPHHKISLHKLSHKWNNFTN